MLKGLEVEEVCWTLLPSLLPSLGLTDSNCRKLVQKSSCKHRHSLKLLKWLQNIIFLWRGMSNLPGNQVWLYPPFAFHVMCQYLFIIVFFSHRVRIHINSWLKLFLFKDSGNTSFYVPHLSDLRLRYIPFVMAHVLSLLNRKAPWNFQLWN